MVNGSFDEYKKYIKSLSLNDSCLDSGLLILEMIKSNNKPKPHRVGISGDNDAIQFEFIYNNTYRLIEIYDTGEIVILLNDKNKPLEECAFKAWDLKLNNISEYVERYF